MVDLWVLFINNFAYRSLGMNEDSAYDSLIVALFVTCCSLIIIGSGLNFIGGSNSQQIAVPVSIIEGDINMIKNRINQTPITIFEQKLPDPPKEPEVHIQPVRNDKPPKEIIDYFVSIKPKKVRKNKMNKYDMAFTLDAINGIIK